MIQAEALIELRKREVAGLYIQVQIEYSRRQKVPEW
jgi:hypothetical protein